MDDKPADDKAAPVEDTVDDLTAIMEATRELNQDDLTLQVGDIMMDGLTKDYDAFVWKSTKKNFRIVEQTNMQSAFLPLFIEGESNRTGRRPFRRRRRAFLQDTYTCCSAEKPIIVPTNERMTGLQSRLPMVRPSVKCDCPAFIKVRYENHEDVGAIGPDVQVTVFYNKNHNKQCNDRFALVDGVMLSKEARDTLDALILSNENDSNLTILSKYYMMFVLREMQLNQNLKSADEVYKKWEKNPDMMPRNLRASSADVKNARARVAVMIHQRATNDAVSVQLWTDHNQNETIFYQPQEGLQPFVLIFFTLDMEEKFKSLGNKKTLLMDATFGTNHWRFPLTTFMVMDEDGHGYPVAWALHSGENKSTYLLILDKLAERMGPNFWPSVLLIDDACAEIAAFQSSVWHSRGTILALCIWHVKRSWLKKLISVVREKETRQLMMDELTKAIYAHSLQKAESLIEAFCTKWATTEASFVKYFRENWDGTRVSLWVLIGRASEFSNQLLTTTSALERYHGIIKENDLSQKKRLKGRRIDWLLLVLMDKVAVRYAVRRVVSLGHKWLQDHYRLLSNKKVAGECAEEEDDDHTTMDFGEVDDTSELTDSSVQASVQALNAPASSNVALDDLCPVKIRNDIIGTEVDFLAMETEMNSLKSAISLLLEYVTRVGSLMVARQATLTLQRAIITANLGDVRSSEPFKSLPGDNSLKRKDPSILGGPLSKRRTLSLAKQSSSARSDPNLPVTKFIANKKQGKARVGRKLSDQLGASKDHEKDHDVVEQTIEPTVGQSSTVALLETPVIVNKNTTTVGKKNTKTVRNKNTKTVPEPPVASKNCYLCGKPICSPGFAFQNGCPVMESPTGESPSGDGLACTDCFEQWVKDAMQPMFVQYTLSLQITYHLK